MQHIKTPLNSILFVAAVVALASGTLVASSTATAEETSTDSSAVTDGVVVFYFHGNVRCATCRKIEAYSDEAIHSGFAKALEDGALTWSVVNIDEPEDKHFVEDFQLVTRSVVLVEYRDGEVARFKNLDKVWQLVRNEGDFIEYVQNETTGFLAES